MILFKRLEINDSTLDLSGNFDNTTIFQTKDWIYFLSSMEEVEPVVAAIQSNDQVFGYFTGFIVHKFGLRILGSPFRGYRTYFMGFSLKPEVSYYEVLKAFPEFAFKELKCNYLEITDPNLKQGEWKELPYCVEKLPWFSLDLTLSEEEMFANMKGNSCRRAIRGAIKKGVVIEEANDLDFASNFYTQYQEVMARKSIVPAYNLDLVQQMIKRLLPTGNILLVRARNPDGISIATAIFVIFKKVAVYWGGASLRQYLDLHPNELIFWYAMKKLKSSGVEILHMGGEAEDFKRKLGCYDAQIYRLMKPRNPLLKIPIYLITSFKSIHLRNWILRMITSR